MAVRCQRGINSGLEADTGNVVTGIPITIAVWAYAQNDANFQHVLMQQDKSTNSDFWRLLFVGNVSGDPVRFEWTGGGTSKQVNVNPGFSINTYHLAVARVRATAPNFTLWVDSSAKKQTLTAIVPSQTGIDLLTIGNRRFNGALFPGGGLDGRVAEVAMWRHAEGELLDADIEAVIDDDRRRYDSFLSWFPAKMPDFYAALHPRVRRYLPTDTGEICKAIVPGWDLTMTDDRDPVSPDDDQPAWARHTRINYRWAR